MIRYCEESKNRFFMLKILFVSQERIKFVLRLLLYNIKILADFDFCPKKTERVENDATNMLFVKIKRVVA